MNINKIAFRNNHWSSIMVIVVLVSCFACKNSSSTEVKESTYIYPSDVIQFLGKCSITLGNGNKIDTLIDFEHEEYFYTANDGIDWIVYKTPNSGITTPNSKNTRTELQQTEEWYPKTGGKLQGELKVMHVSTSGDATRSSSYAVVVGQIHGSEGHENEPLKIYYKKFPGHTKGSVFWNYEINTEGDNAKRWDHSNAVWGYDMSVTGSDPVSFPDEPENGIELGEVFSYEVNVHKGVMYLSFSSPGHPSVNFTKSLIESEFSKPEDIPQQTRDIYAGRNRGGTEQADAYANELQYFKQGAYNQTNGSHLINITDCGQGSDDFSENLAQQYANGCYSEVWFKSAYLGPSSPPK